MNSALYKLFQKHGGYLTRQHIPDKTAYNHLLKMVETGSIERIKRGVYRLEEIAANQTMADVNKIISGGVLCLYSAWAYYELTLQIPQTLHIAVEKSRRIVLPTHPPITLYYWKAEYQSLGVVDIKINNTSVKIYDLEKSVCDAVKYRTKTGTEVSSEILKNYLKRGDRNLTQLMTYAKKLRIEKTLRTYLEIEL